MAAVYHLKYRDGRAEEFWTSSDYFYVLNENQLVQVSCEPGWCFHCDEITNVERFDPAQELEEDIRKIEDPNTSEHKKFFRFGRHFQIRKELDHLKSRISPRLCLECGHSNVHFFPFRKWAPHPKTREDVYLELSGVGSTSPDWRFFSPDGKELSLTPEEKDRYRSILRQKHQ
jgi:hypothetical protein